MPLMDTATTADADWHGTGTGWKRHHDEGTPNCDKCRRERRISNKKYKVRRMRYGGPLEIDATGTRRRIQALGMLGWSYRDIGKRCGVHGTLIGQVVQRRERVNVRTAERVRRVYDDLYWTRNSGGQTNRTINEARKKAWVPPQAWSDDAIDDPDALPEGLSAAHMRAWLKLNATERQREIYRQRQHVTAA